MFNREITDPDCPWWSLRNKLTYADLYANQDVWASCLYTLTLSEWGSISSATLVYLGAKCIENSHVEMKIKVEMASGSSSSLFLTQY